MAQQTATRSRRANIILLVLVALSLLLIAAGAWLALDYRQQVAQQSQPAAGSVKKKAPDFALKTADGATIRLSDLRGKVVLLNFWATWCPPCKAEMPDLNALYEKYGTERDFVVLGVNMEEGAAEVIAFATPRKLTLPLLLDSDGKVSSDRYAIRSLPTSLIIDREGNICDTWVGQISREAMEARLQRVW